MGKPLSLFLVGAGVTILGVDAKGVTLYDSGGYDSTARFSTAYVSPNENVVVGNVRGQDAAVNPWFFSGVSNTVGNPTATARCTGLYALRTPPPSSQHRCTIGFSTGTR